MIAKKMVKFVEGSSVTRAMFEEGKKMAVEFGAENVYDFSLGNPSVEPPKQVKEAIIETLNEDAPNFVHGYMNNSGYEEVRERIAQSLNCRFDTKFSQNNIIMTVGAAGGLNVALKTLLDPGDEVIAFAPYFGEYNNYVANFDGVMVVVPADVPSFQLDLETFAKKITAKTKAVIVNNPNNPTGTVVDSEELKEFIHKVPKDIIIVVDEAYIELSSNPDVKSMVSEISDDTNVVVARTFSKLYGLAGVRLGYAMCNKEMHAILQKCTSVFTGSRVALAGAMAALDDEEYIKKTKAAMLEGRKYLTDEFTKMGFYVYPSETNFLYVNTGYNAAEFAEECKKYGLIIRGNFEYSRITVGRMDQNEKMVGIIKKIIESGELKKI